MAKPPFLPEDVWADFNDALSRLSGPKEPSKAEIRALVRWMLDALDTLGAATGTDPTSISDLRRDLLALDTRVDTVTADQLPGLSIEPTKEFDWDAAFIGKTGRIFGGVYDGDMYLGHLGSTVSAYMRSRDGENVARSQRIRAGINARVNRIHADYNLVLGVGQSLMAGMEGWPALSKSPLLLGGSPSCYMVGNSVRGTDDNATANPAQWLPVGGSAVLNPLIATNEDQTGAPLTDAAVAALAPGNTALGENMLVSAANYLAREHYNLRGFARNFVAMSAAVSGRSLEELSPGATPNLYGRVTSALAAFKTAVGNSGTSAVAAIVFDQGQYNYLAINGAGGTSDPTRAGYLAKLTAYYNQIIADVMTSTGQATKPAFFIVQSGGSYTRDGAQLGVGMAQWDFAQNTPGVYLVGGSYDVVDKYGHLDPNGYRWMGNRIGKVMTRTLLEGQGWEPLSPFWVQTVGRWVYIGYHVPAGPIGFGFPYEFFTLKHWEDRGFIITDNSGLVPVKGVSSLGSSVLRIELARAPDLGSGLLWYGPDNGHAGGGEIRDGDQTFALNDYSYTAGNGQYAVSNLDGPNGLVGKPYQEFNWSIAFNLPLNWVR